MSELEAKFTDLLNSLEGESVLKVMATIRGLLNRDERLAILVETIQSIQEDME